MLSSDQIIVEKKEKKEKGRYLLQSEHVTKKMKNGLKKKTFASYFIFLHVISVNLQIFIIRLHLSIYETIIILLFLISWPFLEGR